MKYNYKPGKLLKVLDHSEDQQKIFLVVNDVIKTEKGEKGEVVLCESLADLAFRLRDEMVKREDGNWCEAEMQVYDYLGAEKTYDCGLDTYFVMYAQPVYWIIAALIAQEMGKKDEKEK
jgi:hypothetical protein